MVFSLRQKIAKNPRQVTPSRFRSSNELLQERKKNVLGKIRMQTSKMVEEKGDIYSGKKNDRKAEKDKTVVVID